MWFEMTLRFSSSIVCLFPKMASGYKKGVFLYTCGILGLYIVFWRLQISSIESEAAQSCPTLCDSMDCNLPDSSVYGIFQARVLEWVAPSFSIKSSQPMIEPRFPSLQADAWPSEPWGKPFYRTFSIEGLNSSSAWNWGHWNVTRFHWWVCNDVCRPLLLL